ncbi:MAG: type IV pili twitching motility protein PilT, partial [Dehalococcoidia bacterium]
MHIDELLRMMVENHASDLHLKVGARPILRIHGELVPLEDIPELGVEEIRQVFNEVSSEGQRTSFMQESELDFAYSVEGLDRFRVN